MDFKEVQKRVDYDIENLVDKDSWESKKIYDSSPFLVLPNQKFNIKLGSLLPTYSCFIRKRGEQFGDAMGYDLTDCTISLYIYNSTDDLVMKGNMVVTNKHLGEVTYIWQEFDLQQVGFYRAEIEVTTKANGGFKLPNTNIKPQIIVT